ncbi:MAG: response regulator [Limnothrix sp. CACIAM 69d]|nr:MAG: response regulator [Limnothrix sp. CACIAM 69d]
MTEAATGWTKVSRTLATVVQRRASGVLVLERGPSRWRLIFLQGRLLWAIDEQFRIRRWQRALKRSGVNLQPVALTEAARPLWEVWWLATALLAGQVTPAQLRSMLESVAQEVLFAAASDPTVGSHWDKYVPALPDTRAVAQQLLGSEALLAVMQSVVKLLQRWESVGLSPEQADRAPQLAQLDWSPSATTQNDRSTFLTLAPLLNGQRSTWDVSLVMKQPMSIVVHLLHHLVERGGLDFLPLDDRPADTVLNLLFTPQAAPVQPPQSAAPQDRAATAPGRSSGPAANQTPAPRPAPATQAPNSEQPLVMLIDDDPMVGKLLRPVVHRLGCRFVHITEATRALAAAIEQRPDMVLLDLVMPIVNGYELCTQLRRVNLLANVPIAIVTSNRGAIDRVRAKLVGASVFVPKPLRLEKVAALLQQYLPDRLQPPPQDNPQRPQPSPTTAATLPTPPRNGGGWHPAPAAGIQPNNAGPLNRYLIGEEMLNNRYEFGVLAKQ